MNVPFFVAERYLRSKSSTRFASLVSIVSFLGLVLGVVALIVVVSVMNGFDRELKQRILGVVPHLTVSEATIEEVRQVAATHSVVAITPFQEKQLLLVSGRGSHLVSVYGVQPELEQGASILPDAMIEGSLADLADPSTGIILGEAIVRRLGLAVGDSVSLVLPRTSATGGLLRPKLTSARLRGTFSVGSEMDYRLAVMHLEDLEKLSGEKPVVRVTFSDLFAAPAMTRNIREKGFTAEDWTERFGDFFKTVRMEKIMMFILLSFVIAVASFSIVSGLSMMVDNKRRDIAVLRTMGLTASGILSLFLVQGAMITLIGVTAGVVLGVPLAYYTPDIMGAIESWFGFSIVEGTYFDRIPTDPRLLDISVIIGVASLIGFTATLYPSIQASRLPPAQILRYE